MKGILGILEIFCCWNSWFDLCGHLCLDLVCIAWHFGVHVLLRCFFLDTTHQRSNSDPLVPSFSPVVKPTQFLSFQKLLNKYKVHSIQEKLDKARRGKESKDADDRRQQLMRDAEERRRQEQADEYRRLHGVMFPFVFLFVSFRRM